jgi:hypothetical protein
MKFKDNLTCLQTPMAKKVGTCKIAKLHTSPLVFISCTVVLSNTMTPCDRKFTMGGLEKPICPDLFSQKMIVPALPNL